MDHNQLREDIQNFSLDNCPLGNQGYNRVLLQLFGFLGHGRSALINSLIYVLDKEKYVMHAETKGFYFCSSATLERRAYKLTPTITIMDNRGFRIMDDNEKRTVYAQLGNFMPLNEKVEWGYGYEDFVSQLEDADLDPNYTDFIVPVFVHNVPYMVSETDKGQMRDIFENCRNLTGVFPIVVLTRKTHGNYLKVEKKFRYLGAERIVAVENYSEEDQIQTLGRNTDFLTLLKSALDNVTFRMEYPRNPKEERIERKKFLLKYVHDIDVAERAKETEAKKVAEKRKNRNMEVAQRKEGYTYTCNIQ